MKLTEDEIEDFIFEYDPEIGKRIDHGITDLEEGKKLSLDDFLNSLNKNDK